MPHTDEQVFVKVDGRQIDLAAGKLISVSIEQSLTLPDAFSITLASGLEWLKDDVFSFGKEVKLEFARDKENRQALITGEVTGLMPSLTTENQVHLCVRGYDKSHRLLRGRQTRPFVQMTDSDIAERIAQEMGLGTDIVRTTEVNEYVLQYQQTDLQFLQQRAAAIGYQVGVSEGTLYFKPIGQPIGSGARPEVELRWGETLDSFDVSRTTPAQATEVVVHGWDPSMKAAVVGQSKRSEAGPQTRRPESGGQVVGRAFSMEAPMTVVRADIGSQGAAERLAQVISDELHSVFTTAEGVASGDPDLRAGTTVKIAGAGVFDGKYLVSSAHHVFDRGGYRTVFTVEGARAAPAVPGSSLSKPHNRPGLTFLFGLVTDNEDPQKMGRVKVTIPALMGDLESSWCRVVTPMAGNERGFFTLPEPDDEVLLAFESGDLSRPIVLGALYNGMDAPPQPTVRSVPPRLLERDKVIQGTKPVENGKVVHRIFKSRAGHMLLFDDTSGKEQIVVSDKNGNYVALQSNGNVLKIKTTGNIEVETASNITLKAAGNIEINAGGTLNLRGGRVNIN